MALVVWFVSSCVVRVAAGTGRWGPALELHRATFGETRRRVKVIGRLPGERSCLSLVWAVLDRASRGWRGLTMTPRALRLLQDLRRQLLHPPADNEVIDQAVTAAA